MKIRRLQSRFFLAGCLLVATTVACGVFSALTFARLSQVVDETLRESQDTNALASSLAGDLEREDDALLLSLTDAVDRARDELISQRRLVDAGYLRLEARLDEPEERLLAGDLRENIEAYRAAGDALLKAAREPSARDLYHLDVNPILRRAVGECAKIREHNFRAMQAAGIQARDVAVRSTRTVAMVSLAALVVSIIVSFHLARSVERPIRELTASVEALREGDFGRRVDVSTEDEIGRLGDGFNRMAAALAEFRRSNLGLVLRAKETLEATLAALPDAVIVVGADGSIESLNPPASAFLRATGKEGAGWLEDLPLAEMGREAVRRALRGEHRIEGRAGLDQAMTVSFEGRARRLLPMAVPVRELAPGRNGAVLILYDVTDFARLDELRTELVGVASHELKTPLTTLGMNLLLLREGAVELSPRQREILATAVLGCEQLGATIDELLDLTRIESGQLRLHIERVDVRAAISRAVESLRVRFDDAGIAVRTRVEGDGQPALVRADPARLGAVLSNLLANSLKYTPRGGEVSLEVTPVPGSGTRSAPQMQIAVADTGPGVPKEFRERVFEKFFRVEHERPGTVGKARGAGIGLYLCRQIIEAHGGSISCEAGAKGRGARFVVTLVDPDASRETTR